MNSQRPTVSLAELELPVEEFENRPPHNTNSSNNAQSLQTEDRRSAWRRRGTLGQGSGGHVWLQERDPESPPPHARAVKEVVLNQQGIDVIEDLDEISAMARFSKLKHRDRAVFGEFYGYSKNSNTLFLAMEYFPLKDLKKNVEGRTLGEEECKKIVFDILVGLKIMHAEGIVHRDLKPENIFVASKPPESCWWVKIADFGISKRILPERIWNFTPQRGTPYYNAPEAEGWIDPCRESPGAMDLWSLGVIIYSLATKQYPFSPLDLKQFCREDGRFQFPRRPMLERWSEKSVTFVEALLQPLPRDRLSAEDALRDPWITSMSEELFDPPLSLPPHTPMLSVKSVEEADSGFVNGNQNIVFENRPNLLAAPTETQSPPSTLSMITWPEPLQTISYTQDANPDRLVSPLEHIGANYPRAAFRPSFDGTTPPYSEPPYSVAFPRPPPPLRMITAPILYLDEIPPASFYDFTPPHSTTKTVPPRRARRTLARRETAPTPMLVTEDAIDRISPRTKRTEVTSPLRNEGYPKSGLPDSTSSTREMPLPERLDPPTSPPLSNTSLVWRDTRLKKCLRSKSDSFVQPFYKSSQADREYKQHSALEYIDDPRFLDTVCTLRQAIQDNRDDVVDLLIQQGFDIETVVRDPPHLQYGTALHIAISWGQADVVEILLHRGASVRAKARAELSNFHMRWLEPLHLAAYYGLDKIACMLLARGARIEANAIGNFANKEKRTPLHLAVLGEDFEEVPGMVRLLLEYGADPNVRDDIGMRPGDYAAILGQKGLKADLPSSPAPKLRAMVGKMRIKLGPFALVGPLIVGAAGVAMVVK